MSQSVYRYRREDSNADDLQRLDGPTLKLFYELLRSLQNATADGNVSIFQLKPIFVHNCAFFIFIYGLLAISGVLLNGYFIWRSIRLGLYKSSLHYFLIQIAITHAFMAASILPASLAVLLSRYWIFGDLMCYTLTMVQDLPSRVVLLLFVLIAVDRYRQFAYNSLDALPKHGCVIGIWLISFCLAFPACIFVEFYDMHSYFKLDLLRSIGMCVVNNHSMEEYARAMFVIAYVVPLAIFAFAFTRISVELPKQDHFMPPVSGVRREVTFDDWPYSGIGSLDAGHVNVDVERRIQRYLTACGVLVAASSLPLNVMSVIQFGLTEDYAEKTATYDVTYAVFVWISFLPTIGTPALCLSMMSVIGCPAIRRLMKRFRRGAVNAYARRFSGAPSNSTVGIFRFQSPPESSFYHLDRTGNRYRSNMPTRSTVVSALTNGPVENRPLTERSLSLIQKSGRRPFRKDQRRLSTALISEVEKPRERRVSCTSLVQSSKQSD